MDWYLVHIKPRQEKCAPENLHRLGYQCYLPTLPSEKLRQGLLTVADRPLFHAVCSSDWAWTTRPRAGRPFV